MWPSEGFGSADEYPDTLIPGVVPSARMIRVSKSSSFQYAMQVVDPLALLREPCQEACLMDSVRSSVARQS